MLTNFIEIMADIFREEIAYIFDTFGSQKENRFRGLCDIVSDDLSKRLQNVEGPNWYVYNVKMIHGELRHSPRFPSKYWCYQHTMVLVILHETYSANAQGVYIPFLSGSRSSKCYIDFTCAQFTELDPSIDISYIDHHPPKWFYPDTRNPAFKFHGKFRKPIQFFQYEIWGRISDWIRWILKK